MTVQAGELYECAGCGRMFTVADTADAERIDAAQRIARLSPGEFRGPMCAADTAALGSRVAQGLLETMAGELAVGAQTFELRGRVCTDVQVTPPRSRIRGLAPNTLGAGEV